jgi:AhpD family alkylhydroperoxidase
LFSNERQTAGAFRMTKSYKEITESLNPYLGEVKKGVPEVMKGFSDMAKAATADGALDKKTKELIALAIGIATRCDGCIGFHAKALVNLGATREEIEEVCGMSVYMGGGPSFMYAADALRAFDEFSE